MCIIGQCMLMPATTVRVTLASCRHGVHVARSGAYPLRRWQLTRRCVMCAQQQLMLIC
jgi:hypothetical protein